ncbi:MAG: hypothetical protein IJ449_06540 [Clostridia bacterium]|nr:hypothetical protein [Clostridia bacterium]
MQEHTIPSPAGIPVRRAARKEALTQQNIEADILACLDRRKDVLDLEFSEAAGMLLYPLAFAVVLSGFVRGIFGVILILPTVLYFLYILRRYLLRSKNLKAARERLLRGEYTVTEEPFSHFHEERIYEPHRISGRHTARYRDAAYLCFPGGRWRIPERCYDWSKEYPMGVQSLRTTTSPGDAFYIVSDNAVADTDSGTEKILCAYNKRYFIYSDSQRV